MRRRRAVCAYLEELEALFEEIEKLGGLLPPSSFRAAGFAILAVFAIFAVASAVVLVIVALIIAVALAVDDRKLEAVFEHALHNLLRQSGRAIQHTHDTLSYLEHLDSRARNHAVHIAAV